MAAIAKMWLILKPLPKNTNNDKYHSFDAFILLILMPSEISILSNSSIYTSYKHSSKKSYG